MPPAFGARIVARVLRSPTLAEEWREEVRGMAKRVKVMRQMLYEELCKLKTPGEWIHIVNQVRSHVDGVIDGRWGCFRIRG